MANYDFRNLSPSEFQRLGNDVVSRKIGMPVERFRDAKDFGIDGRIIESDGKIIIIQSKHFCKSPVSKLISTLTNDEYEKIKEIGCDRYIVVTSLDMSSAQKDQILMNMDPFVVASDDIICCSDINAILDKNIDIERLHYKLWIESYACLDKVINAKEYNYSLNAFETAREVSRYYFQSEQYNRAIEHLLTKRILIITGEPGVGKTTMAQQLCLASVADGYEFFAIDDDVSDAFKVACKEKKQIFYFDDFLGANYLEVFTQREDSKIVNFINFVARHENFRFVLTSRTTILNKCFSHTVGTSFLNCVRPNEYVLNVAMYSIFDKAGILAQFLWKSSLGVEYLSAIISDKFYNSIINHRNFNPRILEVITSNLYIADIPQCNYRRYIIDALESPQTVWEQPYTVQLSKSQRAIVDFIVLSGGRVTSSRLKVLYDRYLEKVDPNADHTVYSLENDIKILMGAFVRRILRADVSKHARENYDRCVEYVIFNPSISDYVLSLYRKDCGNWARMLLLYRDDGGLLLLKSMQYSFPDTVKKVCIKLVQLLDARLLDMDLLYISRVGCLLDDNTYREFFGKYPCESVIEKYQLLGNVRCAEDIVRMLLRFSELHRLDSCLVINLLAKLIDCTGSYSVLEYISDFLVQHKLSDVMEGLNDVFHEKLVELWHLDRIDDFARDNFDKIAEYNYSSISDDPDYYSVDEQKLKDLIMEDSMSLFVSLDANEVENIVSSIDLYDLEREMNPSYADPAPEPAACNSLGDTLESMFMGILEGKVEC